MIGRRFKMDRDVVIVSAVRTPFGRFGGPMKEIPLEELGAQVMKEVMHRVDLPFDVVEEIYVGNALAIEASTPSVVGRQMALKAGFPHHIFSLTLDGACTSSLVAARLGYRAIRLGECETVLAVGAQSMSRTGLVIPHHVRWGTRIGNIVANDFYFGLVYPGFKAASADTGDVAIEYGEGREEQDKWAYKSQMRYAQALKEGKFDVGGELMSVEVPQKKGPPVVIDKDEQPRPDTTLEKLAKLETVYGSLTVTAGNAPGLNDGASAVLLMSRKKAKELGLEILGKILACGGYCSKPREMAASPGFVIQYLLDRAKMTIGEMDLIEINEAFAAMALIGTRILAEGNEKKMESLREKTNVNGGAVAIGHPVGASGCRLLMTILRELKRRSGGRGVVSLCGGLGLAEAMIVEV
jgi:acetyl-CoA C-acetyltransferase